jgi:hypothetical protein
MVRLSRWFSLCGDCAYARIVVAFLAATFFAFSCKAQDLQPRRWNHLPIDTDFFGGGHVYTNADVTVDPVLLLDDVTAELQAFPLKYIHTIELAGKSARVDWLQAYQVGRWNGLIDGIPTSVDREGWSDMSVRFAINLIGAPPLSGAEFAEYRQSQEMETIVGLGLEVQLPTGQYFNDKLVNLGTNRFTFRPQLGVVHRRGSWTGEATVASWFYTDNDEFFNGNYLQQDPIHTLQGSIDYTFRSGIWIGTGLAGGVGGKSVLNGFRKNDPRDAVLWGLAIGYPISKQVVGQCAYLSQRTLTSIGVDSDTLLTTFSMSW